MKVLYCILAICVAANADPEPPTRKQLQNMVELLLQNVRGAPESITKAVATTKNLVEAKLSKNKLLSNAMLKLDEKLRSYIEKGEDIPEDLDKCSSIHLNGFDNLITEVSNDFIQKLTTERYGKNGVSLETLKKELTEMQDALENHADQEIESCLEGKSKCRLTEEFRLKSNKFFTFQDIIQPALALSVESANEYFDSPEIGNKIVTKVTHPGYECLQNLSQ